MNNVTLKSIQARYKELFPINSTKEDFIKALEYFKQVDDKRFIVTCSEVNYKPYMIAYLLKYLSTHDRYPEILVLNAHEISEIYITGNQDGNLLRLSDIKADILFLTSGYSEPNNKSLKDCLGFIMNSYVLQDKHMFIYLKGSSVLNKDIETLGKNLELPFYNITKVNTPKKDSKSSKSATTYTQRSLF